MSGDFLLEIVRGEAEPPAIGLSTGEVVGPLSMGPNGSWRMRAPGMIADHGYVYFDGAQLFVRSASPITPISLAGRPVPAAWTAVAAPARIAVAGIEIEYSVVEDAIERTVDRWPAPPAGAASRVSVPPPGTGAWPAPKGPRSVPPAPASQPTLIRPTQAGPSQAPRVIAPSQASGARSVVAPSQPPAGRSVVAPSQAPPRTSERPAPVKPTADPEVTRLGSLDEIVRRSMAARRETEAAMASADAPLPPPAAVPTFGPPPVAPSHPPPPIGPVPEASAPLAVKAPGPVAEASAWAQASLAKKATTLLMPLLLASVYVIFFWQEEPVDGAAPASSATALASNSSAPSAAPAATDASAPADAPLVISSGPPARPLAAGERTLERRAADAVATGDFEMAAQLYEELARDQPDRPAFSEALRIVRAKLARQR